MKKKPPLLITSIDGKIVAERDARIPVIDNTFLYAEGLFETLLSVDNRLIFARRHFHRLQQGARVIGLKLPASISTIRRWMVAAAVRHPARHKKVRLTITSGDSARWTGHPGKPRVVISVSDHQLPVRPYRLQVSEFRVDEDSVFRRIKTVSYAIQAAAFRHALDDGLDDALLLNESDHVAEVTSANIFWIRRGTLYTSPLSAGCLDGTTRKTVFAVAKRLGIPVIEQSETLASVCASDEIFICSSLKLVSPVALIVRKKKRWRFKVGPVTRRLSAHFLEMVETDSPLSR